jgi:hypothetical protein
VVLVALGAVAACGSSGSPAGQPTASSTGAAAATVWQLRYQLLQHYPAFAYCDPDVWPLSQEPQPFADRWWAGTDHASPEVSTILRHLGYHEPLAAGQRLAAYTDHKKLGVIAMTWVGIGYQYQLTIRYGLTIRTTSGEVTGDWPDQSVTGLITVDGAVDEVSRRARDGGCPICLEAGTRIATPHGEVPVAQIRPGDRVWTTDPTGHRVPAAVVRVVRRPTPGPHLMLQLVLSDGRQLVAAGVHPAADGTYLRQLQPGQRYDEATIVSADWVTSTASATFDILPAGRTGTYWANGILVGSTLKR